MNVKELRELYSAAPFQPFEMVVTNGSTVYVGHPEFMIFSSDYRLVYAADERDGHTKRSTSK